MRGDVNLDATFLDDDDEDEGSKLEDAANNVPCTEDKFFDMEYEELDGEIVGLPFPPANSPFSNSILLLRLFPRLKLRNPFSSFVALPLFDGTLF